MELVSVRHLTWQSSLPPADVSGNALDGEFLGKFPTGDTHPGGSFSATLPIKIMRKRVKSVSLQRGDFPIRLAAVRRPFGFWERGSRAPTKAAGTAALG